ncbi:MAG: hypothetical protein WDN75_03550 [Bacteroidota bacterium]
MKAVLLLIVLFFFDAHRCKGQEDELKVLVESMQSSFSSVKSASRTYEHEIRLVQFSTVSYTYRQIDLKGTSTTFVNEFNLADIDPYTVRQETQKDLIVVILTVKNKQKLIKTIKESQTQPYDNELTIHARDVDHARSIMEGIRKGIPLAEKIMKGKLKLDEYKSMRQWLEENVKNVGYGNKTINQSVQSQPYPGSFKLLQIDSDGKSSHQEEFTFNIADINLNSLEFRISGNNFSLNFSTAERLKSVTMQRDGVRKPFTDDVAIYTNGVDEARDIKTVLMMMQPLAVAMVKADYPQLKTREQALEAVGSLTSEIRKDAKTITQRFTPACITTFSTSEQSSGATTTDSYEFNWMDVNPNAVQLKVSGEKMQMILPMTDKRKLINHYRADKMAGYEDEVVLYVEDMEIGRRLRPAVAKTIEYCKAGYKDPFPGSIEGIVSWMKEVITEVSIDQLTRKQGLELAEESNYNKLKFITTEVKASSSVEEIFEFNLSDINPVSIDFETNGKWCYVKFDTNFRNKIIKAYKDGKIQPYVFTMEIAMRDIESARGLIAALKKCIDLQKSK